MILPHLHWTFACFCRTFKFWQHVILRPPKRSPPKKEVPPQKASFFVVRYEQEKGKIAKKIEIIREKCGNSLQNQGFRAIVQKMCLRFGYFARYELDIFDKRKGILKMAAKKKTATAKVTPVQTEEIVKVEAVKVETVAEEAVKAEAVAEETVKVEKKAAKATKAKAEKEVAEKKPAAKRTTKKAVKTTVVVQAAGKEITMEEAVEKVNAAWVEAGNNAADVKELAVYVKPEESMIYYVVNGDVTGKVEF